MQLGTVLTENYVVIGLEKTTCSPGILLEKRRECLMLQNESAQAIHLVCKSTHTDGWVSITAALPEGVGRIQSWVRQASPQDDRANPHEQGPNHQ